MEKWCNGGQKYPNCFCIAEKVFETIAPTVLIKL